MQHNNEALFNSVYEGHGPTLRKLAVRYGLPHSEVEDMLQETFLSYFSHYPIDWEEQKMKAMLSRILKNKCIDYSRKFWRKHVSLDTDSPEEEARFVKLLVTRDSLSIILEQEEIRSFWEAMSEMREDWQEVFLLYFVQDRSIGEVSRILGITENACRTRISRGRRYLKDALSKR